MKPKIDASRLYVFDDLYEIYTQPNSISLYPISQLLGQFLNNTSLLLPNSSNCIITSLPLDFFISQSVNSSLSQSSFLYVYILPTPTCLTTQPIVSHFIFMVTLANQFFFICIKSIEIFITTGEDLLSLDQFSMLLF